MSRRLACALTVAALAALPAAAAPTVADSGVQEWQVDFGTTGLLVEDHRVPLVKVVVELAAGTWSPWVVEHDARVAFELQLSDPSGSLRRRADRLAAPISLQMGPRTATLSVTCGTTDLAATLELIRDVLANRELDRRELARRRQNARIDWEGSLKSPEFVLRQADARLLFAMGDPRRHSFEKPKLPTTDLRRLVAARDALVRFPGRVVGFAGDLTLEQARGAARGLLPEPFAETPPGVAPLIGPLVPAESRPPEVTVRLPRLTQVYFSYLTGSPAWLDPDFAASRIADHALGGHFNSRLVVALRQEAGDTYYARVVNEGGFDPGVWAIRTYTRSDNADAAEHRIREVLARLHVEGVTEEERALAAGNLVGKRVFQRESPMQLLATAMTERRHGLPYGFLDQQAENAAALPLDEVNAVIRRLYDQRLRTMVTLRSR